MTSWLRLHPVITASVASVIVIGLYYLYLRQPLTPSEIISQVADGTSRRKAIVEQISYSSGIQTCVADQVRISKMADDSETEEIVFTEDVEPLAEKPTVDWKGNVLTIQFSRDANVLERKDRSGDISIIYVRRRELVGQQAIGSLVLALKDATRVWSEEELTAKIWETCRDRGQGISEEELTDWDRLLSIDRCLLTDGTLNSEIQVREVAFLCISELIAPWLSKMERPLRQDMGTGRSGKPERFDIHIINDSDVAAARDAVKSYLSSLRAKASKQQSS
jgi:hypothetical protein